VTAYLNPARQRPNLKIVTGALVTRVLFTGRRAAGLEIERGRVRSIVEARRGSVTLTSNDPHDKPAIDFNFLAAPGDIDVLVRGFDALRVVDASVIPTVIAGNSNIPVNAVAERAADLLLGELP